MWGLGAVDTRCSREKGYARWAALLSCSGGRPAENKSRICYANALFTHWGNTHLLLFFDLRKSTHFATHRDSISAPHLLKSCDLFVALVRFICEPCKNSERIPQDAYWSERRACVLSLSASAHRFTAPDSTYDMCVGYANRSHIQLMARDNANGSRWRCHWKMRWACHKLCLLLQF
jgi:hypothetical protein